MRDKDTELMEEAYNNVLVNELNVGKAVKTGVAAAGMLGSTLFPSGEAKAETYPDADRAAISSSTNPELDAEASVDKIVNLLNAKKSIKEIINTDSQLFKSIIEDVKKGNLEQAKRLTYNLQIRKQPLPKFLLQFEQDFTSGKSGG